MSDPLILTAQDENQIMHEPLMASAVGVAPHHNPCLARDAVLQRPGSLKAEIDAIQDRLGQKPISYVIPGN